MLRLWLPAVVAIGLGAIAADHCFAQSTGSPYLDSYLKGSQQSSGSPYIDSLLGEGRSSGGYYRGGRYSYPNYPGYGYPYGPYGYPYYLDMGPYDLGPYVLPPVYVPPTVYGPGVTPFPGLTQPRRNHTVLIVPPATDREGEADRQPRVRVANAESRARAWRFIGIGDRYFAEQKFHSAVERYKTAAEAAPDLADAYFRQGHALVGMRRYDLAARHYRRGLTLDPQWPDSEFRLEELYDGANIAKTGHQEKMAQAATDEPNNPDLLFVLAVHLYFDGESDRALPLFERAFELLPPEDRAHVRPFLKGDADGGEDDPAEGVDL